MVKYLWSEAEAALLRPGLDELVYRSNLIGSDRSVCNWGGGNTSMKTTEKDFRGRDIEVMWVKGSGSDLATMSAGQFTGLRLDDIRPLMERSSMSDEEMTAYLSHCMMDGKHPRPSIETLLHAFLPFPHVDHTHPDAIISICCADNGKEIAEEIFGSRCMGALCQTGLHFIEDDSRRRKKQPECRACFNGEARARHVGGNGESKL